MGILRAIMIGDVVGEPGLKLLEERLPLLIKENSAGLVVANGENAAGGFGLTAPLLERFFRAGVDVVSGGNHIWEKREFWPVLDSEQRVLRPMNYPDNGEGGKSVGRGWVKLEKTPLEKSSENSPPLSCFVVNLQGREFMPPLDCPFRSFDAFEKALGIEKALGDGLDGDAQGEKTSPPIILVDFHAESTREKEALGYYLDGRASIVAGTHTHVQSADERILPKGTAYISDLGMTGVLDGIIGMDPKICIDRARNQVLYRMEAAAPVEGGKRAVQGIIAEIDGESGKALLIKRI